MSRIRNIRLPGGVPKPLEFLDDTVLLDCIADLLPGHAIRRQEILLRISDQYSRAVGVDIYLRHSTLR